MCRVPQSPLAPDGRAAHRVARRELPWLHWAAGGALPVRQSKSGRRFARATGVWYHNRRFEAKSAGTLVPRAGDKGWWIMAVCEKCGKKPQFGHTVSFSKRHNNRAFRPNIQTTVVMIDGRPQRITVCARCLRTMNKG